MEFYDNQYGATAKLLWAYPGQAQQIIPSTRLFPGATTTNPGTGTGTSFIGTYRITSRMSGKVWM